MQVHFTSALVSLSLSNGVKLPQSLDRVNQCYAKLELCKYSKIKESLWGNGPTAAAYGLDPKKSKDVTLTPWMSPFMRNVCWGNVWCNTCRINTDIVKPPNNSVLDYQQGKKARSDLCSYVFLPRLCFFVSVTSNLKVSTVCFLGSLFCFHYYIQKWMRTNLDYILWTVKFPCSLIRKIKWKLYG